MTDEQHSKDIDEEISDEELLEELDDEPVEDVELDGQAAEPQDFEEDDADDIEPDADAVDLRELDDEADTTTPAESSEELEDFEATLESVVESVLFASDEPLTAQRLVNIAEAGSVKQIRECVDDLNAKYRQGGFAFRIEQIAGGYQMMSLPKFNHWLKKLLRVRTDNKLSPAALETLAIISYKQPIIRADIEAIRGVAAGEMIRSLMYKGLVKIVGRAEVLGRPMLYGTSKKFLDTFGLNTLKDLPKIEELKKPQE